MGMLDIGSTAAKEMGGAALLTATVVSTIAYEIHESELKKQEKYIEALQEVEKQTLAKPAVPGAKPLAPIFSKGSDGKPTPTTCVQIDVLDSLYHIFPVYNDPHLRAYGYHVMNAMRAIAKFYSWRINGRNYFWRGNKNDITSSVLSYLIIMLSEHCVAFEGYEQDINTLQNVMDFINGYASLDMGLKDERFEHMTEAYNELVIAKQILVDHSKALNMDEKIAEYEAHAASLSERMVNLSVKLILPNQYWDQVAFASMDRLAENVVSAEYQNGRSLTHFFAGGPTLMPDSRLREWVAQNASDYMAALDIDHSTLRIDKDKFLPLDMKDPHYHDQLEKVKKTFACSHNLMTQQVKHASLLHATSGFETVSEDKKVQERSDFYFDLAQLTNRVIVSQYEFDMLWKKLKEEVSARYVKQSHHCDYFFEVALALGDQMEKLVSKMEDTVARIRVDLKGGMQDAQTNTLGGEIDNIIALSKTQIASLREIGQMHQARTKTKPGTPKQAIEVHHEDLLLSLAYQIASTYGIDTGHPVSQMDPTATYTPTHQPLSGQLLPKNERKRDPAVGLLYARVYEMRSYGLRLMKEDADVGKVAVDLAMDLDGMLDDFFHKYHDGTQPTQAEMLDFKIKFHDKLHSKDEEMAVHRDWMRVVGNIAIALTGVGALVLAVIAVYSLATMGAVSLFFSQTHRQQLVADVDVALEPVQMAALPVAAVA